MRARECAPPPRSFERKVSRMSHLGYRARLCAASALNLPCLLPKTIRPRSLALKVTERCNSRCATCDLWKANREEPVTTERTRRLLVEARDIGITSLILTGGEPLLREDLFEILGVCEGGWFTSVVLATNGLLLKHCADSINDSIIGRVAISLNGIGKSHDRTRGINGSYQAVIDALPSIEKPVTIRSLFTRELVPELEEMIAFCKDSGYEYAIQLPETSSYWCSSERVREYVEAHWPSKDEISKGLEILSRHGIVDPLRLANLREYLTNRKFHFNHCILGYVNVYITRGDVYTGCYVFKPVGSILDSGLRTILDSPAWLDSARKMYKLDCPLCTCGFTRSALYENPWGTVARRAYSWIVGGGSRATDAPPVE